MVKVPVFLLKCIAGIYGSTNMYKSANKIKIEYNIKNP